MDKSKSVCSAGYGNIPLDKVGNRIIKRIFDVVFALIFLCTVFPFIFILVSLVTTCTMPGRIFFAQKRTGLAGKTFYCFKFRSMKKNTEADRVQATRNDCRVTRWGAILRKTNLDETPQFINVLIGNMSIVGPRPHMLKHTEMYSGLINEYMQRHEVKPGITGWSQINGFRGETRRLSDMVNRVKYDIWYIKNWRFSLDLYIVAKTVSNILRGERNAY